MPATRRTPRPGSPAARAARTKGAASQLLTAEGLDWTAPATDIDDTLLAAGWTEAQREFAIGRWLA